MMRHFCRITTIAGLAVPALIGAQQAPATGQGGTVAGTVRDRATQQPVSQAQVSLIGTTRGALSNDQGVYRIPNVPAGTYQVRVLRIGFQASVLPVTVTNGETTTTDIALGSTVVTLDQVTVTATGEQIRQRETGSSVATIAPAAQELASTSNFTDVLNSRAPGLYVQQSNGAAGTGSRIRVRGANSLSLSNEPLLIIDGVRANNDVGNRDQVNVSSSNTLGTNVATGGQTTSRLNDINPEDIENIEVIKGPAAATLYGTEASNGVIQIITKRGKSGKPQFAFTTRQGTNWLANPEGRAGMLYRPGPGGQIIGLNLYKHEAEEGKGEIFQNGRNEGYQGAVSGGTDASRYYLSGTYDNDVGIVSWNWDRKFTGRANLDILATDKLRFQGSVGHIRDRIRLAQNDINTDPFSQLV